MNIQPINPLLPPGGKRPLAPILRSAFAFDPNLPADMQQRIGRLFPARFAGMTLSGGSE
jgi:hypothetical protein